MSVNALSRTLRCEKPPARALALAAALLALMLPHDRLLAECYSPDGPQTVVATWDGGKVTVGEVCGKIQSDVAAARTLATYPTYERMYEIVTRQIALRKILLKKAEALKIQETPGWKAAEKLIGERAVAEVLKDAEAWNSIGVADDEAADFLVKHGTDIGKEGSFVSLAPDPTVQGRFWVKAEKCRPLEDALITEAVTKYPVKVENKPLETETDSPEAALTCGSFTLTQAEVAAMGRLWKRTLPDCTYVQNIPAYSAETLSLAQLAKARGYPAKPEDKTAVQKYAVKFREDTLAELARDRLLEEWLDAYAPSDKEIKDYWDNEWTGMADPLLEYDALVVPVRAEPGASEPQRNRARDAAKQKAQMLIEEISHGKSFAELKAADADLQIMAGEKRAVREETPLFGAIAQVAKGGVLSEPYEDFGGFCVMKVRSKALRQKLPLQLVRGAIVGDLKFRFNAMLHRDVNETILQRYRFSKDDSVLSRLGPEKGD